MRQDEPKPKVVVVGAGFGGISAVRELARRNFDVTVIDRQNYHLFQPLLYQVATAGLSPADIAWPIRTLVRDYPNVRVLLGNVEGVDTERREVIMQNRRVPYDNLVLATGANTLSPPNLAEGEPGLGLKTVDDATTARKRILMAFERAEMQSDLDERKRLLTFVVVGGGPTGVEMAGAIAELGNRILCTDYRAIREEKARIVLIEQAERLLGSFPEKLSQRAKKDLEHLGVEVHLDTQVEFHGTHELSLNGKRLSAGTLIWAAGVVASAAGRWINAEMDRSGKVKVNQDLSVPGQSEIFVIGDTAALDDANGRPLPGIAPVAKQQGAHVARVIEQRHRGSDKPLDFQYRHWGNLATVGRKAAVVDMGALRFAGLAAWLFWGVVHIYFLVNLRSRFTVVSNWIWSYLTFERGARLITGVDDTEHNYIRSGDAKREKERDPRSRAA